jgi:hypothetical protein
MSPFHKSQDLEAKTLELLENEESKRLFVHYLVNSLSQEGQELLAEQLFCASAGDASGNTDFARRIGAREYEPSKRRALEIISLLDYFEFRKRLLGDALPATTVSKMLGVSRQTPHDRAKNGFLLGILDNSVLKFPEWQFDPEAPNGVVEGLPEVLKALSCGTFAKISWLGSPNPIFGGLRPIDALRNGNFEDVMQEAQAIGVT